MSIIMLGVIMQNEDVYAECHNAESLSAEFHITEYLYACCQNAESRHAECHKAEGHNAECNNFDVILESVIMLCI